MVKAPPQYVLAQIREKGYQHFTEDGWWVRVHIDPHQDGYDGAKTYYCYAKRKSKDYLLEVYEVIGEWVVTVLSVEEKFRVEKRYGRKSNTGKTKSAKAEKKA